MTERYVHIDDTLVFELPDSGGFLANGQPVARADLGRKLKAVFAPRLPDTRAILVEPFGPSRCADVAFLIAQARDAGVAVFGRRKGGWSAAPPLLPDTAR